MPVGQTVTTDWDRQTRWLENPSADRRGEALIVSWRSDNASWPASRSAVTQCRALQEKWHAGVIAQYHWFVMPWSCGPVMISKTFLSSPLLTAKLKNGKERILSALYFPSSYYGNPDWVFRSCLTLWKTSTKTSTCSALSPQSWESLTAHKALLCQHLQHLPSGLRCHQQISAGSQTARRQQAGRPCRPTGIGKPAAGLTMI